MFSILDAAGRRCAQIDDDVRHAARSKDSERAKKMRADFKRIESQAALTQLFCEQVGRSKLLLSCANRTSSWKTLGLDDVGAF